jgi:glycine cleavage system H protein
VRVEADNDVRIGFTDYGQRAVGYFRNVELPQPGAILQVDYTFGFVQGGYMEYNLTAPVSGTVVQTNQDVRDNHFLINQSPYDAGWLIVVHMSHPDDLKLLLSAGEYANQCCPPCHCAN